MAENVDSSEVQAERESFQSLTQNLEHWSDRDIARKLLTVE